MSLFLRLKSTITRELYVAEKSRPENKTADVSFSFNVLLYACIIGFDFSNTKLFHQQQTLFSKLNPRFVAVIAFLIEIICMGNFFEFGLDFSKL